MRSFTKATSLLIASFVIALTATSVQAVPTLYFNGNIGFDAATSQLSVTSDLIDTADIIPAPAVLGTLNFDALLLSTYFGYGYNIGNFGSVQGDDITVLDANLDVLLTGNFTSLTMSGSDNADSGTISGDLISTGGLLAAEFGVGNVIALQFNLSTTFNDTMFASNFSGKIDGNIQGQSVPEPSLLALLSMGLLVVGYAGKKSRTFLK